jgi:hypothetical protein
LWELFAGEEDACVLYVGQSTPDGREDKEMGMQKGLLACLCRMPTDEKRSETDEE